MRAYDLLLHLYPRSFRDEYGDEMRAVFTRSLREAGAAGRAALWLATIVDVIGNGALVHLDILRQDLAYTRRSLRRTPGFALTAVLIVALGIGATTAAFSVTDFVLIRPLPFPEPDRLVKVWEKTPGYAAMELSPPNYRDWKAAATSFESMGAYAGGDATMTVAGEPRRFRGAGVSADLFPTLGVPPMIGRTFSADDAHAGAAGTIMLSYRLWQTEFGGDANMLGRSLTLGNEPRTVIGVMPREFNFPDADIQFWTPLRFGEREYQDSERTNNILNAVARLKRGVGL